MDTTVCDKETLLYCTDQFNSDDSRSNKESYIFFDSSFVKQELLSYRNKKINQMANEIISLISKDDFVDGEKSDAELYMEEHYLNDFDCVNEALMKVYSENYSDIDIVAGVLVMISSVPYDVVEPGGPLMALGLLSHINLEVRDRAIQCFERWNSKKGLEILKSVECHPRWLNNYLKQVVKYIEKDGIE
jgi:hypothetical protein